MACWWTFLFQILFCSLFISLLVTGFKVNENCIIKHNVKKINFGSSLFCNKIGMEIQNEIVTEVQTNDATHLSTKLDENAIVEPLVNFNFQEIPTTENHMLKIKKEIKGERDNIIDMKFEFPDEMYKRKDVEKFFGVPNTDKFETSVTNVFSYGLEMRIANSDAIGLLPLEQIPSSFLNLLRFQLPRDRSTKSILEKLFTPGDVFRVRIMNVNMTSPGYKIWFTIQEKIVERRENEWIDPPPLSELNLTRTGLTQHEQKLIVRQLEMDLATKQKHTSLGTVFSSRQSANMAAKDWPAPYNSENCLIWWRGKKYQKLRDENEVLRVMQHISYDFITGSFSVNPANHIRRRYVKLYHSAILKRAKDAKQNHYLHMSNYFNSSISLDELNQMEVENKFEDQSQSKFKGGFQDRGRGYDDNKKPYKGGYKNNQRPQQRNSKGSNEFNYLDLFKLSDVNAKFSACGLYRRREDLDSFGRSLAQARLVAQSPDSAPNSGYGSNSQSQSAWTLPLLRGLSEAPLSVGELLGARPEGEEELRRAYGGILDDAEADSGRDSWRDAGRSRERSVRERSVREQEQRDEDEQWLDEYEDGEVRQMFEREEAARERERALLGVAWEFDFMARGRRREAMQRLVGRARELKDAQRAARAARTQREAQRRTDLLHAKLRTDALGYALPEPRLTSLGYSLDLTALPPELQDNEWTREAQSLQLKRDAALRTGTKADDIRVEEMEKDLLSGKALPINPQKHLYTHDEYGHPFDRNHWYPKKKAVE